MKSKFLFLVLAAMATMVACAVDMDGGAPKVHPSSVKGSIHMPLSQTVDGVDYKVTGTITVVDTATSSTVATIDLATISGVEFSFPVSVGNYDVTLSDWNILVVSGVTEINVTSVSQLATPATVNVTVTADTQTNVFYDFIVDGIVVELNPCASALNLACAEGDTDLDGILNGVECPNYPTLVNTDLNMEISDLQPDCNDTDSDNDGVLDGAEANAAARLDPCLPSALAVNCEELVCGTPGVPCGPTPDAGTEEDAGTPTLDGSINVGVFICNGTLEECTDASSAPDAGSL